ncbi:hypothetical protein [Dactylosporangium matsuzakiense]|uniref:Uncharacterized protein n=1 Tax=Dactylosporangium matsuzakiense TaxID=53360 RepID=A0A9W6KHE7_9ACTN|nr:hypothetical protein [Dactylosporangium matsuzakiense]GLL00997.1 hypothetical protein GCM10017581_027380 [Dactylosporangium matsuzakiense]
MSKFSVNVCLEPCPPGELPAALAAAMAPFDINLGDDWNEAGEWDWWRISAGEHCFTVRPGYDGDPRLIHGDGDRKPLRCDGGPRGLLDFEATRRRAVEQARARWEAEQRDFERLVADHPPARPLTAFLARHEAEPDGYPRETAIADHHAQPLIATLNHQRLWPRYPNLALWVLGPNTDPITHYTRDPEPVFAAAAAWAVTTYALLTVDGRWLTRERPGPFGERQADEDADTAYARRCTAYLDDLPPDHIVVRLHCHC